ncbi:hypothetical protein QCA50_019385 [Cerrena zonata]|uniref:Cytochrome P450 n=1 Tax=Cerrena zonata TaxID=2478898 RepID=A0AAW0FHS7_9APHY
MYSITPVLLFFVSILVVRQVVEFWGAVKTIRNTPGFRVVLGPAGLLALIPRLWRYFNIGSDIVYNHYDDFKSFGLDIVSAEIMSQRVRFPKPVALYEGLRVYGSNIIVSEGEEWKRLRKICAPAFTENNARLVWEETVHIVEGLFRNVWGDNKEVVYDNALDMTVPLALRVIGAAGFGYRMAWKDETNVPDGHRMTFQVTPSRSRRPLRLLTINQETLATVSKEISLKALLPAWVMSVTPRTRRIQQAFKELELYVTELVDARKQADDIKTYEKHDLLSNLLAAGEGMELTDREVFSNIFVFLIAGHETTSSALCLVLGLLALYPEEQNRAYEELTKAFPDGRSPTYDDVSKLVYIQCILYETLRMFPAEPVIPKYATEDTAFVVKNRKGENVNFIIPAGSKLMLHIGATHYHPGYWSEPEKFNPSRFLGDWPRDAFLPFSGGMRSCPGRRFAELEFLVVLSMLIMKFKIELNPEPENVHETFEETRDRVLSTYLGTTMVYVQSIPPVNNVALPELHRPIRVPILFTRR